MPKCSYCGVSTKALHTGGDAMIPGDGREDGACSECEPILAGAVRAKRTAARQAKIQAAVAALTSTPDLTAAAGATLKNGGA